MDKNLKSLISTEYAKVYNEGSEMHKYCVNKVSDAVVFENGMIYCFEKPTIEKNFCFGYTLNSENTEDYDDANNMASNVKNDSGDYFMKQNLAQFDEFNNLLKSCDVLYAICSYDGKTNICNFYSDYAVRNYFFDNKNLYKVTENDIKKLIEVNSSERAKFEKRLNTYLKKYGTSKLHTWSYWLDA